MSKSRSQLQDFLKQIDITGKTVLDVGAGSKEHWARNWTKGEPKEYKTADVVVDLETNYEIDLNDEGFKIIDNPFGERSFDVVFCIETLEHVWNPWQAVNNLSLVCRGELYISTPFLNPIHDSWDYLRYTDEWFEKVLPMVGFKKVNIQRRTTESPLLQEFYREEGMRMSKSRLKNGEGYKINDLGYFITAEK